MRYLGKTAKLIRKELEWTQEKLADKLDITVVHLSNIENDKAMPSPALIEKYNNLAGVDMYVLDWCNDPDIQSLPKPVRLAAVKLRDAWQGLLK